MSLKNYVEVELDGKTKLLKFDYNSVSDIEDYFGKGISFIFSEEQVGFNTVRAFYWAGLKWKDHGITIQRVGNMLGEKIQNGEGLIELMEPVMKALKISKLLGDMEEINDDEENNEVETEGKSKRKN